ncbi:hypothetical protein [Blastococcus goldschmidtiae]|uniref:DUF1622 domain-containing protein n=1 Tax=Blastococcus goldschmidtiae TaxID=3075546 RepID=A0ABU2K1U4_9ACTN|nr:hypothetical protein [Blastococcus sp. DSM 46792]MDT0274318.1 hypothetical protein [Blastococcus sp. DSM 46792]
MSALEELTRLAALAVGVGALVAGALVLVRTRRPSVALPVLLELLLAAGLLRLAGDPSWGTIATVAALVLLRRLIGAGLRAGDRSLFPRTAQAGRGSAGPGS